jgi:GNAT superfamily N-acetyltransferase
MDIRLADSSDLPALVALRTYAEAWLAAAGIEQWTDHDRGVRSITAGVETGTTYIAQDADGTVVASLSLNGPDLDFWTDSDDLNAGLHLYKFMLGPSARGTGLGAELLDWASEKARDQGKHWLRLDCWRTNHRLQAYYARYGFDLVRIVEVAGRDSGALMQRATSPSPVRVAHAVRLSDHSSQNDVTEGVI